MAMQSLAGDFKNKVKMHFHEIGDKVYLKLKPTFWDTLAMVKAQNGDSWKMLAGKLGVTIGALANYLPNLSSPNGKEAMPLQVLLNLLRYMHNRGHCFNSTILRKS